MQIKDMVCRFLNHPYSGKFEVSFPAVLSWLLRTPSKLQLRMESHSPHKHGLLPDPPRSSPADCMKIRSCFVQSPSCQQKPWRVVRVKFQNQFWTAFFYSATCARAQKKCSQWVLFTYQRHRALRSAWFWQFFCDMREWQIEIDMTDLQIDMEVGNSWLINWYGRDRLTWRSLSLTERLTDGLTEWQPNWKNERQTDRQADRHTDRQKDRQTHTHTNTNTHTHIHKQTDSQTK